MEWNPFEVMGSRGIGPGVRRGLSRGLGRRGLRVGPARFDVGRFDVGRFDVGRFDVGRLTGPRTRKDEPRDRLAGVADELRHRIVPRGRTGPNWLLIGLGLAIVGLIAFMTMRALMAPRFSAKGRGQPATGSGEHAPEEQRGDEVPSGQADDLGPSDQPAEGGLEAAAL